MVFLVLCQMTMYSDVLCFCVSQVMVFVHARNATVRTAMGLIEMAKNHGETCFFQPDQGPDYGQCEKQVGDLFLK